MPETHPSADNYQLGHGPTATRRLLRLGQILEPYTRRMFAEAGITAGMKVLDVGCGPGDLSLMAGELVGQTGQVLGVDVSAEVLQIAEQRAQAAGHTQVSFHAGDLRTLQLDQEFDAVVGRLILMHLPDPADVLSHLTRQVRSDGVVAFQEFDLSSHADAFFPPSPLWERVWTVVTQTRQRGGGEMAMGMKLSGTFVRAGLPAPHLRYEADLGSGPDWLGYEHWADTIRVLLPHSEQLGIATQQELDLETLADRLREETVSRGGVARLPILVSAWVRTHETA